ncbi:hypothetical protein N7474_003465 [Penicillium riverlandense]|uniref:uncharacterized protein n=1 Tax=Penicillium riverlandense TaxID=1903569 RepID=UPI002546D1A9|nr:uncharacterized protein N7474_003465 [Penicillium riverlandense]KAJ5826327.1 hypothetical protein N7474_003465 [Penicillium riverlandense]
MDEKCDATELSRPDEPVGHGEYIRPQVRKLYDPHVSFEEYLYYTQKTREEQDSLDAPKLRLCDLLSRTSTDLRPAEIPH